MESARYDDRQPERDRSRSPERMMEVGGVGSRTTGVVLRWNEKGFGFIKPDDGGEDIFCHFSSIQDGSILVEGAKVSFVKQWDERKNKERAEEVTGGSPDLRPGKGGGGPAGFSSGPPGAGPGRSTGVALRWNDKGFGFIKPDDGGEDIFCHSSSIKDGDALAQGALVSYVKQWDDRKNKDRAEDVMGGMTSAGKGGGGYGGGYGGGGYGAPPGYGAGYGGPPPSGGYGGGYGAPPPSGGYGSSYGAPPPGGGYGGGGYGGASGYGGAQSYRGAGAAAGGNATPGGYGRGPPSQGGYGSGSGFSY
ncbi:hypothetical protein AB1Y20_019021 [Prymnesium parvum]|uniref:CSD domain-containing protein n=1 Tax=Prymnesium parvum TaxID=97485 RepID=A0AB34JT52_PRYPA